MYALASILYGALLVVGQKLTVYSFFDDLLILLIPPIFFSALYYSRCIYLITIFISGVVTIGTLYFFEASIQSFTIRSNSVLVILTGALIAAEITYRTVCVRRRLEDEKERLIGELEAALQEVKTLSGLLPICSYCKNIRNDKGYWEQIESYIKEHSSAEFTHSICPNCVKTLYPQFADQILKNNPDEDNPSSISKPADS